MITHDLPNLGKVYEVEVRTEMDGSKFSSRMIVIAKNMEQVREKAEKYLEEESPSSKILGTVISVSWVVY